MSSLSAVKASVAVLNQWCLDFTGNIKRIIQAVREAKLHGSIYVLFPELAICGYGCQDHFLEQDTILHSWQCLDEILRQSGDSLSDIVIDVGMPVANNGVIYNCRLMVCNGNVLLIRPKLVMANDGLHRESRWFTPWLDQNKLSTEEFLLPPATRALQKNGQSSVPFGNAVLSLFDGQLLIGFETCEELWSLHPPHQNLFSQGVHLVANASASHHEIRKLQKRVRLVEAASAAGGGGIYMYSNLRGCDSERVCYDGGALVAQCGELILAGEQFSLDEVEVQTCCLNLASLNACRLSNKTFGLTSAFNAQKRLATIRLSLFQGNQRSYEQCESSLPVSVRIPSPWEEIAFIPALWLWDCLRRSRLGGFFLCLSGGIDSASVALIVWNMCQQLARYESTRETLRDMIGLTETISDQSLKDAKFLCGRLLTTCYMSTRNSSQNSKLLAAALARAIGANHIEVSIDDIYETTVSRATDALGLHDRQPRFRADGGSLAESLVLQNAQARTRMCLAYTMAQLLPVKWPGSRSRMLLGSANLDETLRGYFTKYDCSSADLNPIGCISKRDVRDFVSHQHTLACDRVDNYLANVLELVLKATPSAELEPASADGVQQNDEADMGISYAELSLFGRLRKQHFCGPFTMLQRLLDGEWQEAVRRGDFSDQQSFRDQVPTDKPGLARFLSQRVQFFFTKYAVNRHKTNILPPACHIESYSVDDNRFDLRPFLYPSDWQLQFQEMQTLVQNFQPT